MYLDRRTFIGSSLAAVTLAACGGSDPATTPTRLGVRFPDGFRAPTTAVTGAGAQRFPFVVLAPDDFPVQEAPESIDVEVSFDDQVIETLTVARHGDEGVTAYYPLVFTPPSAGRYVATPSFTDAGQEFLVAERADVSLFQIGDELPPFDTPTFDDSRGVTPVCTRAEPCPFHELTLTEALSNGKPTAILISTPEFCQTDVCGPSVESLIELAADRSDLNVIHAEVWADPRSDAESGFPDIAPLIAEWKLDFEPSVFVANEAGIITDARHFAIDRNEMAEALSTV